MVISPRVLHILVVAGLTALIAGCATVGYYAQSIHGQLDIMLRSRPISTVIAQPATAERVKDKLAKVLEMRRFASEVLGLPNNRSYTRYADVGRQYAVWNVFAAPELSLSPRQWCFPVVGCVVYRGYFAFTDAQAFADQLQAESQDVFIGGVPAYSTLGWFTDPVLNTVLDYPEAELAGLIFHELAHQAVYVKNDSVFNESFATAVELEGVTRWLQSRQDARALNAYQVRKQRDQAVIRLILSHRQRLSRVYAADRTDAWKRAQKRAVITELRSKFERLAAQWPGYARFRLWFSESINNAKLVAVSAYHDWVPAFAALLERSGGDLRSFLDAVRRLSRRDQAERDRQLRALMPE